MAPQMEGFYMGEVNPFYCDRKERWNLAIARLVRFTWS